MSNTAKLDVFKLQIREKGNKEYVNLNDISGFKFINELSNYLGKNIYLIKIDNETERTTRIEKNELEENSLYSRIKIGRFGSVSEIVDTLSGSGVFNKEREHSDSIPLFFHLATSNDGFTCYINVEKNSSISLIPEIRSIINTVIENIRTDKYIFELKQFTEKYELKEYLLEDSKKITKIDITVEIDSNSDIENIITLKPKNRKSFSKDIYTMLITAKEKGDLSIVKKILPANFNNLKISNVCIEVKNGNNKSSFNILKTINTSVGYSFNVQKENLDKLGYPSFKFIKSQSNYFMNTLISK